MGGEFAAEILRYLVSQPSAQDTLEGIVAWAQSGHSFSSSEGRVRVAILEMQAKGLIFKIPGRTCTYYRLSDRTGGARI